MIKLIEKELSVSAFIQNAPLLAGAILSSAIFGGGVYECLVCRSALSLTSSGPNGLT